MLFFFAILAFFCGHFISVAAGRAGPFAPSRGNSTPHPVPIPLPPRSYPLSIYHKERKDHMENNLCSFFAIFVPLSEKIARFRRDSRSLTSLLPIFNPIPNRDQVAKEPFSVFASPRLCVFALKGLSLSVQSAKSAVQFSLVAAFRAGFFVVNSFSVAPSPRLEIAGLGRNPTVRDSERGPNPANVKLAYAFSDSEISCSTPFFVLHLSFIL